MREYPRHLVERVANVLLWGVSTSNHPDASFDGWAEQILKVIDHEGYLAAVSPAELTEQLQEHDMVDGPLGHPEAT